VAYRILVVNVASHGHVYPTLATVGELVRRGHRVTYVTSADFAPHVAATGAAVLQYESRIAEVDPAEVFADAEDGALPHMLYLEENTAVLKATESGYGPEPPDLVVYGDFPVIAGQLLAARWDRPAARLSAAFASNETYSFSRDMIEAAGFVDPLALPSFRTRLGALLSSYGVGTPVEEFWHRVEGLTLVFVPKEFQPAGESFDDRFAFVGPCIGDMPRLGGWQRPDDGLPVVLVSLGTTFNDHPSFFAECARAFAGQPWHVVMSVGDQVDIDALRPLPANVEAHRWVSHLAVLEHASACVTHGGMGTVMASLYWGRPLVVAPRSPDVVPMAQQVSSLGLGGLVRPEEVSGSRLLSAVREVTADAALLDRVGQMRRAIREAGGADRAADEIEAYLKR